MPALLPSKSTGEARVICHWPTPVANFDTLHTNGATLASSAKDSGARAVLVPHPSTPTCSGEGVTGFYTPRPTAQVAWLRADVGVLVSPLTAGMQSKLQCSPQSRRMASINQTVL